MDEAGGEERGAPRVRIHALVLLLLLLCGPLVASELLARQQLPRLHPYLTEKGVWVDTRLMLLERAGCPDVLALGSSLTNRTVVAEHVVGRALPFPDGLRGVESAFTFALDGAQASVLYAIWRRIHGSGCDPPFVFVELAPPILNEYFLWLDYYRPVLDAATIAAMPAGFVRDGPLEPRLLVEMATYDRLVLHRRRGEIRRALIEGVGLLPYGGSDASPALDGAMQPLQDEALEGEALVRETEERRRSAEKGVFPYKWSPLHMAAFRRLVDEATAAGSQVVVHLPPTTDLYRRYVDERVAPVTLPDQAQRIRTALADSPGRDARWYDCFEGRFGPADFVDWVHMNRRGGGRYVDGLFACLFEASPGVHRCPRPHRPRRR